MTKITPNQKLIIGLLQSILDTWFYTNNINSPSHHTIIEDELNKLELDGIINTGEEIRDLNNSLTQILSIIRNNK